MAPAWQILAVLLSPGDMIWLWHVPPKFVKSVSSRSNCSKEAGGFTTITEDLAWLPWPFGQVSGWSQLGMENMEDPTGWWARATPLKNRSSSIGMISNPIYGKIIKNVPNHQPAHVTLGIWWKVACRFAGGILDHPSATSTLENPLGCLIGRVQLK